MMIAAPVAAALLAMALASSRQLRSSMSIPWFSPVLARTPPSPLHEQEHEPAPDDS
jgi:hypothetical protein